MKRTKTMVYKPTEESRELMLYAINNGDLYRRQITPVINSLRKKVAKGTYDSDKAVDAWYYVACSASQMYNKDFGYRFSVTDRFTAAVEMNSTTGKMWSSNQGGITMFEGNKIYYITAAVMVLWLYAADYGLTASGY